MWQDKRFLPFNNMCLTNAFKHKLPQALLLNGIYLLLPGLTL